MANKLKGILGFLLKIINFGEIFTIIYRDFIQILWKFQIHFGKIENFRVISEKFYELRKIAKKIKDTIKIFEKICQFWWNFYINLDFTVILRKFQIYFRKIENFLEILEKLFKLLKKKVK